MAAEPARIVDGDAEPDSAEGRLRRHVEAAQASRGRLAPDAVTRVEAAIGELDSGVARAWRALRIPVYALGLAGLGLVALRLTPHPVVAPAPVVVVAPAPPASATPSLSSSSGTLRLDDGTLAVQSDAEVVQVHTPNARVEVAPHSHVRITLSDRAVRIVADAGSARIIYSDGRVELVEPALAPPAHRPVHRAKPAVEKPVAAEALPVAPDGERASLSTALRPMREQPEVALRLLDEHLGRYPDGSYRQEAESARVAVLLRLGRRGDALAALERVSAPTTDLLVLRAELRAEAHRCEEAVGDFGAVLSSDDDRFIERALVGRALCRGELGETARMNEELDGYLQRYPRGEQAERARAARKR